MMSSTLMVLVSVMTVAMMSGEAFATLPAECSQGLLEELPPRLRKLCVAMARIWDVREMNYGDRDYQDNFLHDVKREDVDHVFLRFGKRR